jgi:FkbM family methyltransferase
MTSLDASTLVEGRCYTLSISDDHGEVTRVDFEFSDRDLVHASERVILRNREKLDVLKQLHRYPAVLRLLNPAEDKSLDRLEKKLSAALAAKRDVYIFGAHQIGARIAHLCTERGYNVKGFLDNDLRKRGLELRGIPILNPNDVLMADEIVVVASGRYTNAILQQIAGFGWTTVLNLHEFLFALNAPHQAEISSRKFSQVLTQDAYRFVSAFLDLDDEASRKVFDGLIEMRATLDTRVADTFKSPFNDEYLDSSFITSQDIAYYVDAGAFTGDTLERFERRFGPVSHAYLFEPELPAYYEGLKRFSDRDNVFFYNFGLSSQYAKFAYEPTFSYDPLHQIDNAIPNNITSFMQAIRLDDIVTGKVTLFKLDIEGAEASAIRGASETIRRHRPKLCVCAYHRADDLWKLIDEVKQIDRTYRCGLRHYSDITDDTSLYFY